MKLLSLNIWAGKQFDTLIKFIEKYSDEVDIFCFQEVMNTPTSHKTIEEFYRANIFGEFSKLLKNHAGHFAAAQEGYGFHHPSDFPIAWGIAMFIRKSLTVKKIEEIFIRGYRNSKGVDNTTIPRNLQQALIINNGKEYHITHFHGLWNGGGKTDTDERIQQSNNVRKIIENKKKMVLCGDFNLLPDTKSLEILEKGFVNLIKTHQIESTRSKLYTKPEKFADYTIVSKDIVVKKFEVPYTKASDHLPMILEFS